MNATIYNQRPGKTGESLDGVKCAPGDTGRMVDASHLIALAEAWEECAELDLAYAAMYRRHAAALRELIEVAGQPSA